MKNMNFCIGLPRSGSTLLMNILQQNPSIFTSSTCPTPYLVEGCKIQATSISEFIAMDQDVLTKSLLSFMRYGIDGWYNALTNKPNIISKSRCWDSNLNMIFALYENPKIIISLRDVRDIICSFEKLLQRHPMWTIGSKEDPVHLMPFEKRMEIYCTDVGANLGRPLYYLPHVYEWMQKRPNNFFLFRFEDFNEKPKESLRSLYQWLDLPYFDHDLNNIPPAEQYEHDTVYRALVSHKTETKLRHMEPNYISMMTPEQSDLVIRHNEFFYKTFYPEIYYEKSNRIS